MIDELNQTRIEPITSLQILEENVNRLITAQLTEDLNATDGRLRDTVNIAGPAGDAGRFGGRCLPNSDVVAEGDHKWELSVDMPPNGSRLSCGAPNGSRLSCGALKKDSFLNLRAPPASSAC